MRKIGIVTIHSDLNYGAALQAFALNHFLKSIGYSSEIINYIKIPNYPRTYPFPVNVAYKVMNYPRFKRYRDFLKSSLSDKTYHSVDEVMNEFVGKYDVLISGSDQIWNPICGGLINKLNPVYYLAFDKKNEYKKISYASSLGSYRYKQDEIPYIKKWLSQYEHLSTRETANKEYLETILNRNIKVVLDPTLLLNQEQWTKFAYKVNLKEKYVLIYYFDELAECVEYARKIADKNGWKVALISNQLKKFPGVDIHIPFCGPTEFLWLFLNAQYIVTNSFHGTAFSVNFNKNFISIIKRNSPQRAQTLLMNVGLSERLLTNIRQLDELCLYVDFIEANKRLDILREESINYLINAIEN